MPHSKRVNRGLGADLVSGRVYEVISGKIKLVGVFLKKVSEGKVLFNLKGRGKNSTIQVNRKTTIRRQ